MSDGLPRCSRGCDRLAVLDGLCRDCWSAEHVAAVQSPPQKLREPEPNTKAAKNSPRSAPVARRMNPERPSKPGQRKPAGTSRGDRGSRAAAPPTPPKPAPMPQHGSPPGYEPAPMPQHRSPRNPVPMPTLGAPRCDWLDHNGRRCELAQHEPPGAKHGVMHFIRIFKAAPPEQEAV